MKLFVGGAFQNKLNAAMEILHLDAQAPTVVTDGADCAFSEIFSAQVLNHFHLYLRRCLEAGEDVQALPRMLMERNPDLVIITTELGCGVVPMDPFDRQWRELTGRICTRLACEAEEVYRVVCGIGVRLK